MGCEGCARALLIAFNIIFFLLGAAGLAVGIWVAVDGTIFFQLLGNIPDSGTYGNLIAQAAYVIIAVGACMFMIAFLGCCGAWKRNKCMLVTYAIIIGVLLATEIAAVVLAYFFTDRVTGLLKDNLGGALGTEYSSTFNVTNLEVTYASNSDILSKAVDALQVQFECCGINNYTDYNTKPPPTCCKTKEASSDLQSLIDALWKGDGTSFNMIEDCRNNNTYLENTKGCYDKVEEYVRDKAIIFMGIGGGTLAVQLLLIIFACCVACANKDE